MRSNKSITQIDKHVGARVRTRRLTLGWSLRRLADALGVTYQQVQKYEKGETRIAAGLLHCIANVLKVDLSFFFDGAPGPKRVGGDVKDLADFTEFCSSEDGLALAEAFIAIKD